MNQSAYDVEITNIRKIKRLLNRAVKAATAMEKGWLKLKKQEAAWKEKREVID